ncbi:MAG: ergothioneine biosynthesis protein EgtB [Burkholderiaceae bacterium]|nr:ergothioneine biosynthesis protein EgtB [Burkholderiaceae bacterium]
MAQCLRPEQFAQARARTVSICAGLSAEDCALQSMADASPLKWHLAHTTWFWETFVLEPHQAGYMPRDRVHRYLYNSYYNGVGPQFPRPQRGLLSRPSLDDVRAYRAHVDDAMARLLEEAGSDASLTDRLGSLVALGTQHEEQHQELMLTDFKHLLGCNPLAPVYRAVAGGDTRYLPGARPARGDTQAWTGFDAGVFATGHQGAGFCFDNETPRHRVFLAPFELAERPVSNGDFLRFIAAGGYTDPSLWLSEGFDWARENAIDAPLYWRRLDGDWRVFTLHGEQAIDPGAPVCHVSYYEADAYARFAGARLPTEHEWEHAASRAPVVGQFADHGCLQPVAPGGDGLRGLFGGVWEWTSSSYSPYPGFAARSDAIGEYNGKFMVNQYVLRGGSCATPPGHVRATYRNFFPAATRWQFAGIRLARSV